MSNDLVTYDAKWADDAKNAAASEKLSSGVRFITHRSGVFRVGDMELPELCAVVLNSAIENGWYGRAFDADNLAPPKCFALAIGDDVMAPHPITNEDDYFEPQHARCFGCPKNEWPKKGEDKRKECRNARRLLLLPAGQYSKRKGSRDLDLDLFFGDDMNENAEYVKTGDVFLMKLPPTSLRPYKELVHAMQTEYSRPPHGMIVRIYTEPLRSGGHTVKLEPLGTVPDPLYPAIMARREAETDELLRPYTSPDDADKAPSDDIHIANDE